MPASSPPPVVATSLWVGPEVLDLDDVVRCVRSLHRLAAPGAAAEMTVSIFAPADRIASIAARLEGAGLAAGSGHYVGVTEPGAHGWSRHAHPVAGPGTTHQLLLSQPAELDLGYLRHALAALASDPTLAVIGGSAAPWDDRDGATPPGPVTSFLEMDPVTAELVPTRAPASHTQPACLAGPALVVDREVFAMVGGFDDAFTSDHAVADLVARIRAGGRGVAYDHRLSSYHGARPDQSTALAQARRRREQARFAARHFEHDFLTAHRRYLRHVSTRAALDLAWRKQPALNRAHLASFARSAYALSALGHDANAAPLPDRGYSTWLLQHQPAPVSIVVDATAPGPGPLTTLARLATQTVRAADVVVVISSAQTDTAALEQALPGIRLVRNRGYHASLAWSLGCVCARERWLLPLTAGDAPGPEFVETLLRSAYVTGRPLVVGTGGGRSAAHRLDPARQRVMFQTALLTDATARTRDRATFVRKLLADSLRAGHPYAGVAAPLVAAPSDEASTASSGLAPDVPGPVTHWGYRLQRDAGRRWTRLRKVAARVIPTLAPAKKPPAAPSQAAPFRRDQVVVFIIVRDRLADLRRLVAWLEAANLRQIVFIDNDSTYPPLCQFLSYSPYQVLPLGRNVGHLSPWTTHAAAAIAGDQYYVVTDPDVVPDDDAPADLVDRLADLLARHRDVPKAGLALRIDDLPDHYQLKADVLTWEAQFWRAEVEPDVFRADIDTTFALYRPHASHQLPALRLAGPYTARHLAWYVDSSRLTDEERHYRARLNPGINTWNQSELPAQYRL